jgi:uncharacterized protein
MKRVFADTSFLIARAHSSDVWYEIAKELEQDSNISEIVTTEEVLTEFLNFLTKKPYLRGIATRYLNAILSDPRILVIPQSHGSFLQGLHLYQDRPDKLYSLTDCISMETMKDLGIEEALTSDHHFAQEGFTILMK